MTSLKHLRELHRLRTETEAHNNFRLRSVSHNRTNSPFHLQPPSVQFIRTRSSSRADTKRSFEKKIVKSTKKIYTQLSQQLSQIQESVTKLQQKRKKQGRSKRIVTENAEEQPKRKLYEEMIEQIQSIKRENRAYQEEQQRKKRLEAERVYAEKKAHAEAQRKIKSERQAIKSQKQAVQKPAKVLKQAQQKQADAEQEKTLFYGMEYIQGQLFKVKIKLSATQYSLLAKNNQQKVGLELSQQEYMKLHESQLKGNPCNIFKYLRIEKGRLKVRIEESRSIKSLRGYIGKL